MNHPKFPAFRFFESLNQRVNCIVAALQNVLLHHCNEILSPCPDLSILSHLHLNWHPFSGKSGSCRLPSPEWSGPVNTCACASSRCVTGYRSPEVKTSPGICPCRSLRSSWGVGSVPEEGGDGVFRIRNPPFAASPRLVGRIFRFLFFPSVTRVKDVFLSRLKKWKFRSLGVCVGGRLDGWKAE